MSALLPIFDCLWPSKVVAGSHVAAARRPFLMLESSHCTVAAASVAINSLGAVLDREAESLYRIWF
jgi:hypothetical protein